MFLLDTNVLTEISKGQRGDPGVLAWIAQIQESSLFLSVLTFGEIRKGIAKVTDAQRKATIETFYHAMHSRFAERTLSIDISTVERWGTLVRTSEAKGIKLPVIDSLLAAVALEHNFTLVTRNVRDFRFVSIPIINPWSAPTT